MNYMLEETEDSNPHLTTIRTVSSSCRCASNYTSLLWVVIWMMKINHLFGFFRTFPCSPDCNVLGSACTDNSSFRCSPSAYLMQISWIFVWRASFRQVTASIDALQLLLLHAYYFVHQHVKELSSMSAQWNSHLTQDCRCPNDLLYKV